jgi:hypothetical protein
VALDVAGFWSYARADDEAETGRVVLLAREIQAQYALATAEDLELFVDRDIEWGDDWEEKIDRALARITFFIPIVTPRWFQSEECRREFARFFERAEVLGVTELVLPLYYADVDGFDRDSGDELVARIARINHEDWRALRLEDLDSAVHRKGVEALVRRLKRIRDSVAERPVRLERHVGMAEGLDDAEASSGAAAAEDEPAGMIDELAKMEEILPRLGGYIEELNRLLQAITAATEEVAARIGRSDAAGKGFAGRLVAARALAKEMEGPAARISELGTLYGFDLLEASSGFQTLIILASSAASEEDRTAACELFAVVRQVGAGGREFADGLRESMGYSEELARMSRDLRPPIRQMQDGLRRFSDGQGVIDLWVHLIDRSPLDCSGYTPA